MSQQRKLLSTDCCHLLYTLPLFHHCFLFSTLCFVTSHLSSLNSLDYIFTFLSLSHHCKALNSLICADVLLRNYSLTPSFPRAQFLKKTHPMETCGSCCSGIYYKSNAQSGVLMESLRVLLNRSASFSNLCGILLDAVCVVRGHFQSIMYAVKQATLRSCLTRFNAFPLWSRPTVNHNIKQESIYNE